MKPDSSIDGRKKKERHLHRLQLVACHRRKGEAHRQVGHDEHTNHRHQQGKAALHGHLKQRKRRHHDHPNCT
jgi:hypothetical protein